MPIGASSYIFKPLTLNILSVRISSDFRLRSRPHDLPVTMRRGHSLGIMGWNYVSVGLNPGT